MRMENNCKFCFMVTNLIFESYTSTQVKMGLDIIVTFFFCNNNIFLFFHILQIDRDCLFFSKGRVNAPCTYCIKHWLTGYASPRIGYASYSTSYATCVLFILRFTFFGLPILHFTFLLIFNNIKQQWEHQWYALMHYTYLQANSFQYRFQYRFIFLVSFVIEMLFKNSYFILLFFCFLIKSLSIIKSFRIVTEISRNDYEWRYGYLNTFCYFCVVPLTLQNPIPYDD